jgi:hypothetical protein
MSIYLAQTAWIQNALQQSTARFKIVYFHHSPYSTSRRDELGLFVSAIALLPIALIGIDCFFSCSALDGFAVCSLGCHDCFDGSSPYL